MRASPFQKQRDASLGPVWICSRGEGPIVATAIHAGHEVRSEVAALMAIDGEVRRREEDPLTSLWTDVAATTIRVLRSRFEVDLNRPREKAVLIERDDTWGLDVWKWRPPCEVVARSLELYDAFYVFLGGLVDELTARFGKIVVFDIHSYNHRRLGPDAPPDDPACNPEINLGTGTLDRGYWAPVIDRFVDDLRSCEFEGRQLDVRENVKFRGGHLPKWLHERYPESVCVLSLECKKFFMDEWRASADVARIEALRVAFQSTMHGVVQALERV